MAGKIPSKEEIASAVQTYIKKHPGVTSNYDEATDSHLMRDENQLEVILGPAMACTSAAVEEEIREIILGQREASPQVPAVRKAGSIRSRSEAGSVPGSALEAVRECQATEKATYSTGKGKRAASAKTNIAALMEMGGSLDIVKRIHTTDYIEVVGRATLGDRHVESSRSFYKQEYLAKKAWEWIIKVLIKEPDIVVGTDQYGMPEFKEGAIIKTRISDDDKNSFLVPLPAKIALWREMAREWQSAGRVCETVAYSRACDMLLRADFQSSDELKEEQSEVSSIQENAKAEAA